jgi:hypothetical protein
MKALKSPLAREVLADPLASEQLRQFMVARERSASGERAPVGPQVIVLRQTQGRTLRLKPVVVPKAA